MFEFVIPERPMDKAILDQIEAMDNDHIAIQQQEDEDAIEDRIDRLYDSTTQNLGERYYETCHIVEDIRKILDESATPYEMTRVAMVVMQKINYFEPAILAKNYIDRLFSAIGAKSWT